MPRHKIDPRYDGEYIEMSFGKYRLIELDEGFLHIEHYSGRGVIISRQDMDDMLANYHAVNF